MITHEFFSSFWSFVELKITKKIGMKNFRQKQFWMQSITGSDLKT